MTLPQLVDLVISLYKIPLVWMVLLGEFPDPLSLLLLDRERMQLILLLARYIIDCLVVTMMRLTRVATDPGSLWKTSRRASIVGSELFLVGSLLMQDHLWLQGCRTTVICI